MAVIPLNTRPSRPPRCRLACRWSDGHAKNFSFLIHGDGSFSLAPLYDAATITYYQPENSRRPHQLALSIGGERAFGQVTDRHWQTLAAAARIEPDQLIGIVRATAAATPDAFRDAFATLPAATSQDMANTVLPVIKRLCWSMTHSKTWDLAPRTPAA